MRILSIDTSMVRLHKIYFVKYRNGGVDAERADTISLTAQLVHGAR